MYNNLKQALHIIHNYTTNVKPLKRDLGIEDGSFEQWLEEEHTFLCGLEEEPEEQVLEVSYVEARIFLDKAECVFVTFL